MKTRKFAHADRENVLLFSGSGEIYGFVSSMAPAVASGVGVLLYGSDATATGVDSADLISIKHLTAGVTSVQYDPPLEVDKGFAFNVSASGCAGDTVIQYSPVLKYRKV